MNIICQTANKAKIKLKCIKGLKLNQLQFCYIKYGQFKLKNRINGQKWAKWAQLKNFASAFGTLSFSCL